MSNWREAAKRAVRATTLLAAGDVATQVSEGASGRVPTSTVMPHDLAQEATRALTISGAGVTISAASPASGGVTVTAG